MKLKNLLFAIICLCAVSTQAQKMDWYSLWGSSTEGSHIRVQRMVVDSEENIYTAASFCGDQVTVGEDKLVSKQSSDLGDAVLIKMNSQKQVQWLRIFSESKEATIKDVITDGDDNVIVAGTFTGIINPGGSNPMEMDAGEYDDCVLNAFVVKFDKSGNLLSQWNIPVFDLTSIRIATDRDNNVYVTGTYGSYIELSEGVSDGEFGTDNQIFLAKYNPQGSLEWKKLTTDPNLIMMNSVIQIDRNGEIYVAGSYIGTYNFAGQNYVSASTSGTDMILTKYDAGGNELWARSIGGERNELPVDIALSPVGDVAVGGTFASTPMTISGVDSVFTYRARLEGNEKNSIVTTFTKNGDFRWQYWYGYGGGTEAAMTALRCTDEGVYYVALYGSGRAGDMTTGDLGGGNNNGILLADGQHISHNTNGGGDPMCLVISPDGKLCNFMRPCGRQSEIMRDIAVSPDKKSIYFLYDLCVRDNDAEIPLNNFWNSGIDVYGEKKLGDFQTIIVPCPETPVDGKYTAQYKGLFFSGCLLRAVFPDINPQLLPEYTGGTAYSQSISLLNAVGEPRIIPLRIPDQLSFDNGILSGTLTGKDVHYVTVIASDHTGQYSYFTPYDFDQKWDSEHEDKTTRGNSRNVRNFILKSTEATGMELNKDNNRVIFYPTLVETTLNVNTTEEAFKVNIYSNTGARMLSAENTKTINVSSLAPGIYFAEIAVPGQQKMTERFIVK